MSSANSFEKIEEMKMQDDKGNSLSIILAKNSARVWRIEFLLNDVPVRPSKITGSQSAQSQWKLLQSSLKMVASPSSGHLNLFGLPEGEKS